jgi:hypothetical protein
VLRTLGHVAHHEGDDRQAAALFAESLMLNQQLGERRGIAACLAALGAVAGTQGRRERAARLYGATQALLDAIGAAQLLPHDQATYERNLATVHTQLGDETFAVAWAAGRAMPLEEVIAEALDERVVYRANEKTSTAQILPSSR